MKRYFCSDTIFNLSNMVLYEYEIKVLEKDLDFAPTLREVNESELRQDFESFCRCIKIKWNFRNEPSDKFDEKPACFYLNHCGNHRKVTLILRSFEVKWKKSFLKSLANPLIILIFCKKSGEPYET